MVTRGEQRMDNSLKRVFQQIKRTILKNNSPSPAQNCLPQLEERDSPFLQDYRDNPVILNNLPLGILTLNKEGNISFVNQYLKEFFDFKIEKLINYHYSKVFGEQDYLIYKQILDLIYLKKKEIQ